MRILLACTILLFFLPLQQVSAEAAGTCLSNPPFLSLSYDDSTPEKGGVQQNSGDAVALKLTPPEYPFLVQRISVNIVCLTSNPTDRLELRIYDDDNGGAPGTLLLDGLDFSGVPLRYEENIWVDIDISAYNIVVNSGSFYVAVVWQSPMSPGLGIDTTAPNEMRTWVCEGGQWNRLSDIYPWASDDQAMIRAYGVQGSAGSSLILQSLYYDDGSADRGGIQQIAGDGVALRFTPPSYPFSLQRVAIDIANYGGNPADPMELRIYGDNNGMPGNLLAGNITFSGSPVQFGGNIWVDVDVSSQNIVIEKGDVYVTVIWKTPMSPGLGIDIAEPNELRTWVYENGLWDLLSDKYPWAYTDQAMIRVLGYSYTPSSLITLAYDDGSAEQGGIQQIAGDAVALRFTPPAYPYYLKNACIAIANFGGDPTDKLEVQIYDDDNGTPGALLADNIVIMSATPPPFGEVVWVCVDLSSYDIAISDGNFFVAVEWQTPMSPGLGIDQSGPNEMRTWVREGGRWSLLPDMYPWAASDQAMIRVSGALTNDLTQIYLCSPPNGIALSSAPTFEWGTDAGVDNVFAVDASLSPNFKPYWSTYANLHQLIDDTSWTMPQAVWQKIPPGRPIYWRVRGVDLDKVPLQIVTSDESRYFIKR